MKEDIHCFLPPETAVPFAVEMCGISYCDGSYAIAREHSPVCVAEYIVKGTGVVTLEGVTETASAGDMYILPPGSRHAYHSDSRLPWTKIFINAWGPLVSALLDAYGLTGRAVIHACPVESLFRELFVLTANPADPAVPARCALKFHEILAAAAAAQAGHSAPPDDADRLKALLDGHPERTFSIRELAAHIYRSEDYVIKLFKRRFGQTPHAYHLDRKICLARTLLAQSRLSVTAIAARLGYDDPQYFSHVFRRLTGESPSAYRKKTLGAPDAPAAARGAIV